MDFFSTGSILSKLNHYLSAINHSSIELLDRLLGFISILVPNKCKTSRVTSPPVSRDENVDDLPVLFEEGEQIICTGSEGDVEDEERVGVFDVWRTRPSKVRHLLQRERERERGRED